MRVLVIGAGGVGSAATKIAQRRNFFESWVLADYDRQRAETVIAELKDSRFVAEQIDASNAYEVSSLCKAHRITHVLNAVDPRFVISIFNGAFSASAHYLDTAMSLSKPHPTDHRLPIERKAEA